MKIQILKLNFQFQLHLNCEFESLQICRIAKFQCQLNYKFQFRIQLIMKMNKNLKFESIQIDPELLCDMIVITLFYFYKHEKLSYKS